MNIYFLPRWVHKHVLNMMENIEMRNNQAIYI